MNKQRWILAISFIIAAILYITTRGEYSAFLIVIIGVMTLLCGIAAIGTGRRITLCAKAGDQTNKDELTPIKITVENDSVLPVFRCVVTFSFENIISGEKTTESCSFSVGPKRKRTIEWHLKDKYCGFVSITEDAVRVTDPLGVFVKKLPAEKSWGIYVLPRISTVPISRDRLNRYDMESYKYSSDKKGSDPGETFGIRQYASGDSIKSVHWKLSGKMDDIMIRELGLPIENRLMILIDKTLYDGGNKPSPVERDKATELFLSLSDTIAEQKIPHSIGWYDHSAEKFRSIKVSNREDLRYGMEALLKSPYREDELTTVDHYLESDAEKNFSDFIYVTDNDNGKERLMNYGEVDIYSPESGT